MNGVTKHTLYIANDNDFTASVGGIDNPNTFYVFAFDRDDLPGYVPQQIRVDEDDRDNEHKSDRD